MADVRRLINPDADPVLLEGEIVDDAAAAGDRVRVLLPALSGTHTTDPLDWPPRPDGRLPRAGTPGDTALVATAQDTGRQFIVTWVPNDG